jgi:hypothetical protein
MKRIIRIFIILIILCPFILTAHGWQWANHIGGTGMDNATISYIDNQHNIYIYGRYAADYGIPGYFMGQNCYFNQDTLIGRHASFIAKYSNNGNLIWLQNIVSSANSGGYATIADMEYDSTSNALFLTGAYSDSIYLSGCNLPGSGTFLSKIDLNGNCLWAKNLGAGCGVSSICFDNSGNLFLGGNALSSCNLIDTCHFGGKNYISKFNSNGVSQWAKTKVTTDLPYFTIQQIKYFNNDIFAFGYVGANNDVLTVDTISVHISCFNCFGIGLMCMDNNGNAKWLKVDGLPYSGISSRSVGISTNGSIYCYAVTSDTCIFSNDSIISHGSSLIVVKYDHFGSMQGYNHLKQIHFDSDPIYYPDCVIDVLQDGTYYVTGGLWGIAYFGSDTITAFSPLDLTIAHFNDKNVCLGIDHIGGGQGTSVAVDETGIYITGQFPPFPADTGTIIIGNNTFSSFGYKDIILAKHALLTGINEVKRPGNNSLIIYANPNKGSFRVIVPDDFINEKSLVLNIYDNKGKLIKSQNLQLNDARPTIDIYGVVPGEYSIIVSNGRKSYSGKMIVE